MTENLPILYQNILFGLPTALTRAAFLWAVERPNEDRMCYRAEGYAREVHRIVRELGPMHDISFRILRDQKPELFSEPDRTPEVAADLMRFILTRHANWRFGGNVKPSFLEHITE